MDDIDKAPLLASSLKESEAWLHAVPISAMGLRLEDESFRIAVGLHLWAPSCAATINANIMERGWMLWEGMGLAVSGVRGDITNTPL